MTDDRDQIDDPDGPVALGADIEALLADPTMWEQPGDDLADRIVDAVRSESELAPLIEPSAGRTRTRWIGPALLGAAAAIVLLFAGVVVFSAIGGSNGSDEFAADLVSTGAIEGVGGSVEVRSFESGLRIDLDAEGLPRREAGLFYEGWLRTDDDRLIPVGTFHDGVGVVLWAGIEPDDVVAFTITREQAEGVDSVEQRSSGDVVLKATFAP